MMMALSQDQSDTGRDLLIITAASYLAVLIWHVTHNGITTCYVMPVIIGKYAIISHWFQSSSVLVSFHTTHHFTYNALN